MTININETEWCAIWDKWCTWVMKQMEDYYSRHRLYIISKTLAALPTRDAAIVPITIMLLAEQQRLTISQLLESLPQRYTYSDRLKNFPTELSKVKLADMISGDDNKGFLAIQNQLPNIGGPVSINTTDGLRITFDNEDVVHLRA